MSARRRAVAAAIREAVDSCPDGLCFAAADGRPILVNRRMNALAEALTGRTVLDAGALWAELAASEGLGGARRLRQPWLPEGEEPALYFRLPGGTVWRFRRLALEEETVQLEAVEVTELCRLSQTLYENNCRLRALQARQKACWRTSSRSTRTRSSSAPRSASTGPWEAVWWPRSAVWPRGPTRRRQNG